MFEANQTIGKTTVNAKEWKKNGQHRIYFSVANAQACFDVIEGQFIKVRNRVNARWENAIFSVFELGKMKSDTCPFCGQVQEFEICLDCQPL